MNLRKPRALMPVLLLMGPLFAPLAHMQAQTAATPDSLYETIQALDTRLFDAYNHCNLQEFGSLLADDLEFYHDVSGLSRSRQATVEAVKKNICGKVTRQLVPGTLEVYPIASYGAVEIGVHRFYQSAQENAKPVGEAKFIHLWENKDGTWKLSRVISFAHHPLTR